MQIKWGSSRVVILTKRYAFKFPHPPYKVALYRNFLQGLLCNQSEREFTRLNDSRLCPVIWYIPGGWLAVMPRCEPIAREDWEFGEMYDWTYFWQGGNDRISLEEMVEDKHDSFGLLNNRLVAVDYGDWK